MSVERNSTYWSLVRAIRRKEVVLFVGSGVSTNVLGLPTWDEVVQRFIDDGLIAEEIRTAPFQRALREVRDSRERDPLFTIEQCRKFLRDHEFADTLIELFETERKPRAGPLRRLKTLLELGHQRIITTNYDDLLTVASQGPRHRVVEAITHADVEHFDEFLRKPDSAERRTILHLHGKLGGRSLGPAPRLRLPQESGDDRREIERSKERWVETIVLSELQYQELYRRREIVEFMEALFSTHPALFIGFGLEDEDVMSVFRRVLSQFPASRVSHFALMARSPSAERSWLETVRRSHRYGVGLIEFDPGPRFGGLWDAVEQLREDVESERMVRRRSADRTLVIDLLIDHGFPHTRNLAETVALLNDLQDRVRYRIRHDVTGLRVRRGFDGTRREPRERTLRPAKEHLDAHDGEVDGVFVITDQEEARNYLFAEKGFGGFITTGYWSTLGVRPSVDEYLQHTLVLLTLHYWDHTANRRYGDGRRRVAHHEEDRGCIFDHTVVLRHRIAVVDYPRLCDGCVAALDGAFAGMPVDLDVEWVRRVLPILR